MNFSFACEIDLNFYCFRYPLSQLVRNMYNAFDDGLHEIFLSPKNCDDLVGTGERVQNCEFFVIAFTIWSTLLAVVCRPYHLIELKIFTFF